VIGISEDNEFVRAKICLKCGCCGLFGCVSQISLKEFVDPDIRKELFHKDEGVFLR